MEANKIGIIIVTYNSHKTIKKCIESVIKYSLSNEIIIFDNNSSDNTLEILKQFGNKIIVLESKTNLGFSKANNLGVDKAQSEYLIFLNPDATIIKKGSLEELKINLEINPDFGLIGPKLISPNGQIQKSVRNLPTAARAFKEYNLGVKGAYDFYLPDCQNLCEIESVVGACMIVKKEVFIKAGKFNEKYFMYFEDLELCKSIRKLGLKIGYLPGVEVEHTVGVSGKDKPTYLFAVTSAKKYHGIFNYYLIELTLFPYRVLNKIKSIINV